VIDDEFVSDYDEQMDAIQHGLLTYEGTHCVHGTFVGNWAGPDYMCGYCEMGVTDEEFQESRRIHAEQQEKRQAARNRWGELAELPSGEEKAAAQLAFINSEEGAWLFR
jgi:hypothetical protein